MVGYADEYLFVGEDAGSDNATIKTESVEDTSTVQKPSCMYDDPSNCAEQCGLMFPCVGEAFTVDMAAEFDIRLREALESAKQRVLDTGYELEELDHISGDDLLTWSNGSPFLRGHSDFFIHTGNMVVSCGDELVQSALVFNLEEGCFKWTKDLVLCVRDSSE